MAERHAELPWKFSPWHIEEGPSAVRCSTGYLVCETAGDADAKLIVKAVNNHDALVAALQFIADGYDNQDVNHVDFRVKAYQVALEILERVNAPVGGPANG